MYKLTNATNITRLADGASIPTDPRNGDYAAYLAWVAAGNTPAPADIPDPKLAIQASIDSQERAVMLPRGTREFMLAYMTATFTSTQLASNPGFLKIKAFDDRITALRAQTK